MYSIIFYDSVYPASTAAIFKKGETPFVAINLAKAGENEFMAALSGAERYFFLSETLTVGADRRSIFSFFVGYAFGVHKKLVIVGSLPENILLSSAPFITKLVDENDLARYIEALNPPPQDPSPIPAEPVVTEVRHPLSSSVHSNGEVPWNSNDLVFGQLGPDPDLGDFELTSENRPLSLQSLLNDPRIKSQLATNALDPDYVNL